MKENCVQPGQSMQAAVCFDRSELSLSFFCHSANKKVGPLNCMDPECMKNVVQK